MTDSNYTAEAKRPEVAVGALLIAGRATLAVAESCTGGALASLITDVPGSSNYFLGGVVAYHDSAKVKLLGVDPEVIRSHGAVSRECATVMAEGVRSALGADYGISITGIAGPAGGSPEKPVGTVYIGIAAPGLSRAEHYVWDGDRAGNKRESVAAALALLLAVLRRQAQSSQRDAVASSNE